MSFVFVKSFWDNNEVVFKPYGPWSNVVHKDRNRVPFGMIISLSLVVDEASSGEGVNDMYPPKAALQYLYVHIDGTLAHVGKWY